VLCSGTAGIFKTLNGIMHRTNQFIMMMKPTLKQVGMVWQDQISANDALFKELSTGLKKTLFMTG
jgi:hypothetical protein